MKTDRRANNASSYIDQINWAKGSKMLDSQQREIYHSENGDRWSLCKDADHRVYIEHRANLSSGGKVTRIEVGAFLAPGKFGPEHQALYRLIASLIDAD